MDRTKASDAFNAGSIPVGCIENRAAARSNSLVRRLICYSGKPAAFILCRTRDFVGRHKKVVMPLFLLLCLLLTFGLAFGLRRGSRAAEEEKAAAQASTETSAEDVEMELNAYDAVNSLMTNYYQAVADGDADAIQSMSSELSDEEKIRVQELANYIDSYTQVDVYTKMGPVDGSYVAYVYTKLKMTDRDWQIPGLQTMYVCTKEDGSLYINNDETQPAAVSEYIQEVSVQDDVVDLNNQTAAEYNELLASDAELADYLDQIASTIDISVGQQLAALNESRNQTDENTVYLEAASDNINIRKSSSADGTRIGSASKGDRFQLVEELSDGWSEIIYNGQSAYVKAEYFNRIEPEETETTEDTTKEASSDSEGSDAAEGGSSDAENAGDADSENSNAAAADSEE